MGEEERKRMRDKEQGANRKEAEKDRRDVATKARLPLSALESSLLGEVDQCSDYGEDQF